MNIYNIFVLFLAGTVAISIAVSGATVAAALVVAMVLLVLYLRWRKTREYQTSEVRYKNKYWLGDNLILTIFFIYTE